MCTNVSLDDLNKLPQREMDAGMKKRVQYLHENSEQIGKLLQQGGNSQETRSLALDAESLSEATRVHNARAARRQAAPSPIGRRWLSPAWARVGVRVRVKVRVR